MTNSDLNAIRNAIAEKQGRKPRTAPGRRRGHAPAWRLGSGRDDSPAFVRAAGTALLTLAATVLAITAAQLAAFWIGDHAVTHGREWGVFQALGFKPEQLPKGWGVIFAVLLEFRLLPWLILLAVCAAVLARPYQAVLVGLVAGLVPGNWAQHVPTYRFPDWVGTILDKQSTWLGHGEPWRTWIIFLVLVLVATAWAERTQAV